MSYYICLQLFYEWILNEIIIVRTNFQISIIFYTFIFSYFFLVKKTSFAHPNIEQSFDWMSVCQSRISNAPSRLVLSLISHNLAELKFQLAAEARQTSQCPLSLIVPGRTSHPQLRLMCFFFHCARNQIQYLNIDLTNIHTGENVDGEEYIRG